MLGLIGAMDQEVSALLDQMENLQESRIGFTRLYSGTLRGQPVCLARCGIGKVHAALCAQAMILQYRPEALINFGIAGALRDGLAVGDVVIARSAVQHDIDTTPIGDPPGLISGPNIVHVPCDEGLRRLLAKAAEQRGLRAVVSSIATGDQFIADPGKKDAVSAAFDAAACDMEGGAIAQCCYEMSVPYAAYRAISDTKRGDAREYAQKALFACEQAQKLLSAFIPLYRQASEVRNNG